MIKYKKNQHLKFKSGNIYKIVNIEDCELIIKPIKVANSHKIASSGRAEIVVVNKNAFILTKVHESFYL